MKKEDGRKIPRDAMEYFRMQAIRLWKNGKEVKEIAEFFGVTLDAVYKWIRKYNQRGLEALKKRKAKGATPKLTAGEMRMLLKKLERPATEYGFETPLWDCKRVQHLMNDEIGKRMDYSNIWRMLKRLGLSYQVPERHALQKDERAVKRWLNHEWPKIQEHRRRWQAMLYFQDESGVSLIPFLGRTWARKGETPKVKVTGSKGSIVVTSAISTSGRMVFRIEKGTIDADEHINFLRQVLQQHPHRKIIIVEDNARPHIAASVGTFAQEHRRRLAIYRLPSYAPELNPHEEVWNYLKHVKLKSHQVKSLKEFVPLVRNNMISIRQKKGLIRAFFIGSLLY